MEIEILKEMEMPLLERKRVVAFATFHGPTPATSELRKELAKKTKAPENLIAVRHVYQQYGGGKARVIAHVYKDEEQLCKLEEKEAKRLEADKKKAAEDKKKKAEEAKAAEAAKAAETPKEEEKKEEKSE